MDFNIRIRKDEDQGVVLEMSGKLNSGEPVALLRESIQSQLRNGAKHILLDMSAVSFVDSAGLGEMLSSLTALHSRGGTLKMTGLNTGSNRVIRLTGLEPVLNAPSQISPHGRTSHWKSLGIALGFIVVAAAFYWIVLK